MQSYKQPVDALPILTLAHSAVVNGVGKIGVNSGASTVFRAY